MTELEEYIRRVKHLIEEDCDPIERAILENKDVIYEDIQYFKGKWMGYNQALHFMDKVYKRLAGEDFLEGE